MASKIISSSSYEGRYLRATVTQTTNGSSANTSTISWVLESLGSDKTQYTTGPTTLTIAGQQVYYKGRTSWSSNTFPVAVGSASGSFTLAHSSTGALENIAISLSTAIYTSAVSTTDGVLTTDQIARYFSSTPSISIAGTTETSITYSWKTSETCDYITLKGFGSDKNYAVSGTSGSITISGLSSATAYSVYGVFRRADSGLTSNSGSKITSTYSYPYVTGVSNSDLSIGNTQTVYLYNPLARSVTVYMNNETFGTTGVYASAVTTGTSAILSPSADILYATIPDSFSATVNYYCYYGTTKISYVTGKYSVRGDENPTILTDSLSFKDSNTAVTKITGQGVGGYLVQNLSSLEATLGKVVQANKSASIAKCEIVLGAEFVVISNSVNSTATIPNIILSGTHNLTLKATDSRGLVSTQSIPVTIKPYSPPTIELTAGRENNYGTKVDLGVKYNYSPIVEGLNGVKVSWSGADQTGYLKGSASSFDIVYNSSMEASTTLENIDNNETFAFTATIEDKFGKKNNSNSSISIGIPIAFVDSEQNGVGINCFPGGEGLWVNGENINGRDWNSKKLEEGVDLNTLTEEGAYYCDYIGTAQTMQNLPVATAFNLRVYRTAGVIQEWSTFSNSTFYTRGFYADTWSPWRQVAQSGDDVNFGSATMSSMQVNNNLKSYKNGNTITIGSDNTSWCHYITDAPAHYFNKPVAVSGTLKKGSNYNLNVPAVFIQSWTPTASQTGDIWFKV